MPQSRGERYRETKLLVWPKEFWCEGFRYRAGGSVRLTFAVGRARFLGFGLFGVM